MPDTLKKVLLVSPDFNPQLARARSYYREKGEGGAQTFLAAKGYHTPLGLATVAALTSEDYQVDIWDEAVHGVIDEETALPGGGFF